MLKFEEYLASFNNKINLEDFLIGLLVTAVLAEIIRLYYIRYGESISNRRRFANNFLPLALGTMLIITILKTSIALSLGLVGALSIVRFRAAIKDPEELTFLFLVIGLGLASGASHFVIALVAIPLILLILWVHTLFKGKLGHKKEGRMYLNIETQEKDVAKITSVLSATASYLELTRMDTLSNGLSVSYLMKTDSIEQLEKIKNEVLALSADTTMSVVEQPDLII